jgi:predicted kinase
MTTLYLIRGVPGSGKSTFAQSLRSAGVVTEVFEADQFFVNAEGDYKFNPSHLYDAHAVCQDRTELYLREGFSVAVSNTSTTEKEVETYRKIAKKHNAYFVSIIVENRHGGVNVHNVPEEKIQQMKNRFSVKL